MLQRADRMKRMGDSERDGSGGSTVRGGMMLLAARLGVSGCSLLFYAVAARWVGDREQLAPVAAMAILAELVRIVGNLGLPATLLRRVPAVSARGAAAEVGALLRATLAGIAVPTLGLGVAAWLGRGAVLARLGARDVSDGMAAFVVLFAVVMGAYDVLQTALLALQRFGRQSAAHLLTLGGQRLLALVGLLCFGVVGGVAGFALGAVGGTVLCLWWLRREILGGGARAPLGELVRYSLPYYLQGFARYVFHEGDQLIAALALSPASLVNYFLAKRIAHGLRMVIDAGTDALRPRMGTLAAEGRAAVRRGFAFASRFMAYLVLPLTLGTAAASGPLMALFAGRRYAEAGPILCALAVALLAYGWFSLYEVSIHMLGRPVHRLLVDAVCAGVMLVGFAVATGPLGALGVALGRLGGFAAAFGTAVGVLRCVRPLRPDPGAVRGGLLAAGAMSAAVALTATALPQGGWLPLHVAVGAGVFVWAFRRSAPAEERRRTVALLPGSLRAVAGRLLAPEGAAREPGSATEDLRP